MLQFAWLFHAFAAPHPALKNVFIMFGDDVGYGDIGAFGHPTSKTPHLDAFARSGSKLLQYLSAASICSPSRGSLMTGRLWTRLGIYPGVFSPDSIGGLQLNESTLASSLRGVGFTTGMVGKVRRRVCYICARARVDVRVPAPVAWMMALRAHGC
jgi:hypothetical protein